MSALTAQFSAMVAEMRPQWDAAEALRCGARADWFFHGKTMEPPRPLTVDDYRAAVLAFDAGDLMSDNRSEWLSATYQADEINRLARIFDPDRSIRNEIEKARVLR